MLRELVLGGCLLASACVPLEVTVDTPSPVISRVIDDLTKDGIPEILEYHSNARSVLKFVHEKMNKNYVDTYFVVKDGLFDEEVGRFVLLHNTGFYPVSYGIDETVNGRIITKPFLYIYGFDGDSVIFSEGQARKAYDIEEELLKFSVEELNY